MPGSNPLFGLNTLGGALSIQTKDGQTTPGTTVQAIYGSDARRAVEFEHGGRSAAGLHWYLAGNLFAEDGWRDDSPSDVRQFFGKLGWQRQTHDVSLTVAYADNSLTGNGLQEQRLPRTRLRERLHEAGHHRQSRRRSSTSRRGTASAAALAFSGNAYYRDIRTNTLNGDINEDSLDQSVYQPSAAEQAALAAAGYTGVPDQRRERREHAVSVLALHRQRRC